MSIFDDMFGNSWRPPTHQHKWSEVSRTVTPHPPRPTNAENLSREQFNDLIFGFTTIELRCSECGDLKHIKVSGNVGA